MGGHGALISALKYPGHWHSVSAFAPVCNPIHCGWGQGCFGAYLGDDQTTWRDWDATELILAGAQPIPLLIDQGTDDEFLSDGQLRPEALIVACQQRGFDLRLRMQPDYDHSYHFIATFIGEHLAYHARALEE